jgi:hypothetical protein
MFQGEDRVIKRFLPFGTQWPMSRELRKRATKEAEQFQEWVAGLRVPEEQARVLSVLLEMTDEHEFVEGRPACVTYEAELACRTGLEHGLSGVLVALIKAGYLTSHSAAGVFGDGRPGVVFRVRRPDVVLSVEAAGPLWMADSWVRRERVVSA